jgi:phage portal protein BeeE
MQHTTVTACVTVISEPLGKPPINLRKPDAWQTRLEFIEMIRLGGDIAAWCVFLCSIPRASD